MFAANVRATENLSTRVAALPRAQGPGQRISFPDCDFGREVGIQGNGVAPRSGHQFDLPSRLRRDGGGGYRHLYPFGGATAAGGTQGQQDCHNEKQERKTLHKISLGSNNPLSNLNIL